MAGKKYRAFTGVLYPDSESYDCSEKLAMLDGAFNKWAFVLHDKDIKEDGTPKKAHYHWVGYRNNGVFASTIAKALGIPENDIEIAKFGWRPICRYLTHIDYKDKAQYNVEDCTSNFDLQALMLDEVTSEDMAKSIYFYLAETGCTSTAQLVRWSFDNGCFTELRRSFSLWQSIMQENKQEFKDISKGV